MPSPTCTVNSSSTTNGVNVTAASTPTIALADATGVTAWTITCIGTDDSITTSSINSTLSVNQVAKTATYTAPGVGTATIWQSQVNNGLDVNGKVSAALTTTFGVFVLTSGRRVMAVLETLESSQAYGWITDINSAIRGISGGAAIAGDVTGTLAASIVSTITGTAGTVTVNASNITFGAGVAAPTINQAQSTTGAGVALTIAAQAAKTGSGAAGGILALTSGAGDGAGAGGNISFKVGATVIGTFNATSNFWGMSADAGTLGLNLVAGATSQRITLNTSGASGFLQFVSGSVLFQDASAGAVLSYTLNSTGATSISIAAAVTGFTLGWSAASGAGALTTIAGQAAGGSNQNGGGIVYQSGAATGAGTVGTHLFKVGATNLGTFTTNGNLEWAFIMDAGRSGISFDASVNTNGYVYLRALGATTGNVFIDVKTQVIIRDVGSATALTISPVSAGTTTIQFAKTVTSAQINQAAQTTDIAPTTMAIAAGSAWTSAVTNLTGATLNLSSGTNKDGVTLSTLAISPSSHTFIVGGTTSAVLLNGQFAWDKGLSSPSIIQSAPVSDVATTAHTIAAQNAWVSAVTNTTGGTLFLKSGTNTDGVTLSRIALTPTSTTFTTGGSVLFTLTSATALLGITTSISTFTGGEIKTTITVTNTNRTLDTSTKDCVIFVNTSTTPVQLTMPAPVNGRRFRVIDINGTLSTNNLTIVRNGSEKINGVAASKVLTTNFGEWDITTNGTDWYIG